MEREAVENRRYGFVAFFDAYADLTLVRPSIDAYWDDRVQKGEVREKQNPDLE